MEVLMYTLTTLMHNFCYGDNVRERKDSKVLVFTLASPCQQLKGTCAGLTVQQPGINLNMEKNTLKCDFENGLASFNISSAIFSLKLTGHCTT